MIVKKWRGDVEEVKMKMERKDGGEESKRASCNKGKRRNGMFQ